MLRQGFPTKKAAVVALGDVVAGSSKGDRSVEIHGSR